MTDFGARAVRLCGHAGRLLGWSPEQFWSATPAELACILPSEDAGSVRPMARDDLRTMMEQDPDG